MQWSENARRVPKSEYLTLLLDLSFERYQLKQWDARMVTSHKFFFLSVIARDYWSLSKHPTWYMCCCRHSTHLFIAHMRYLWEVKWTVKSFVSWLGRATIHSYSLTENETTRFLTYWITSAVRDCLIRSFARISKSLFSYLYQTEPSPHSFFYLPALPDMGLKPHKRKFLVK